MTNVSNKTDQPAPNIDINAPYTPRRPAPIISVSINHPIATVFKKVKNFLTHKQTLFSTSFTIKITPIVASLPSPTSKIIVTTPTPLPLTVSREGTIKATYQLQLTEIVPTLMPIENIVVSDASMSATATPSPKPTPTVTPIVLRYILVSKSGSITFLTNASTVHLQPYTGLRVLITGTFDTKKNTIHIETPEAIEILQ